MSEPASIVTARRHLSMAEASYRSAEGLFHLQEGLALLDEVRSAEDARTAVLAKNLALTYAGKLCALVSDRLGRDAAVPEPELEHLLKVLFAFDDIEMPIEQRNAMHCRWSRSSATAPAETSSGHSPENYTGDSSKLPSRD